MCQSFFRYFAYRLTSTSTSYEDENDDDKKRRKLIKKSW